MASNASTNAARSFTPLPSNPLIIGAARRAAFAKLDSKIQNLPQELQDHILEWTLIATLPVEHEILVLPPADGMLSPLKLRAVKSRTELSVLVINPAHYKPPVGLQLNQKIRDQVARSYYGATDFYVRTDRRLLDKCYQWLRSLTQAHRDLIGTIQYAGLYGDINNRIPTPHDANARSITHWLLNNARVDQTKLMSTFGQQAIPLPRQEKFVVLLEHFAGQSSDGKAQFACSWFRGDGAFVRKQEMMVFPAAKRTRWGA